MISWLKNIFKKKYRIYHGNFHVTKRMVKDGKIKKRLPDQINGNFYCAGLELTTLEGCPKIINGVADCSRNKLTSLKGCPEYVKSYFMCDYNFLTSVKDGPKKVGESFIIDYQNDQLKTLKGYKTDAHHLTGFYIFDNFKSKTDISLQFETRFLMSRCFSKNEETYYDELLNFMSLNEFPIYLINSWPDDFIESLDDYHKNLLKSSTSISKFSL